MLPFPVHVIERVEVIDGISRSKSTTQYRYHHGYWDGADRELRGFGRVEQLDTVVIEEFNGPGLDGGTGAFDQVGVRTFSPPLLTKTSFTLVRWVPSARCPNGGGLTAEFFAEDPPALPPPASREQLLQSLPATRRGEALRSLRGQVLRTEVYALDGTDRQGRPYTVTERQYGIREENAPAAGDPRARVFFPYLVAERISQWKAAPIR